MNAIKKTLIGAGIVLGTLYATRVCQESKELSDAVEPIRADFEGIVANYPYTVELKHDGDVREFNYNGKLKAPTVAKNKFAKDNGAFARRWDLGNAVTPHSNTPCAIAYNPFRWNEPINTTAVKNYTATKEYQKNNKYRMK